jgi:hypothetical protein
MYIIIYGFHTILFLYSMRQCFHFLCLISICYRLVPSIVVCFVILLVPFLSHFLMVMFPIMFFEIKCENKNRRGVILTSHVRVHPYLGVKLSGGRSHVHFCIIALDMWIRCKWYKDGCGELYQTCSYIVSVSLSSKFESIENYWLLRDHDS